ncbi:hypothetical protein CA264_01790 [Pontibacter actiniarum]|uniref:Uncharacterized protein n=1 Tax=Pontibacter actiniarum TaxID=323450 RepID=A0A1X9YN69_9BACT|nr:hypothetical protein CA264_01790 [Pontibacter actiniarum]
MKCECGQILHAWERARRGYGIKIAEKQYVIRLHLSRYPQLIYISILYPQLSTAAQAFAAPKKGLRALCPETFFRRLLLLLQPLALLIAEIHRQQAQ